MAPSAPLPPATSSPSTPKIGDPEPLQSSNGHPSESEQPASAPARSDFKLVSILHSSKSPHAGSQRFHGARSSEGQDNDLGDGNAQIEEPTCPEDTNQQGRRSVQWKDIDGKDLVQVWEFEASDTGSDVDDDDGDSSQSCTCVIQ